jgi:hypothetical protein
MFLLLIYAAMNLSLEICLAYDFWDLLPLVCIRTEVVLVPKRQEGINGFKPLCGLMYIV